MKKIAQITFATVLLFSLAACKGGKKDKDGSLNDKKVPLEKLKSEKDKRDQDILKLQEELSKLDTTSSNPAKIKLVAFTPIARQDFEHYIELQGRVDAENISYISPNGQGGLVKAIYVRQGDNVRKGQLLLKLDDAILRQNVQTTKQQAGALNSQLALARTVAQRQKNLWDKGIGTEVQLLTSQSNVSTLENQVQQVNEAVKLANEQLNTSNVYSNVSGVADVVSIRVGETFTPGSMSIKIVNTSVLKVTANIPENYLGSVQKGTKVMVDMPDVNKTFSTAVNFIGASIDAANRGFVVEAKLPSDPALKPNQIALVKIRDYSSPGSIAIPLNTLQNDEKGKFVLVASDENGKLFARKRVITIGQLSGNLLEVKSGLKDGDKLITEGYTGLYEGQQLTTAGK